MSLLGTRRAADELSRALDGGRSGSAGVSAGAAPLVALGERLRVLGGELESVAVPREDFRAALRTRLVAVATVQPVAPAPAAGVRGLLTGRGQKAVGVAAGAIASVVAVSGVAVASTQALPGDPFYGVKRTAEALQLQLAGDGVEEGDRHLQFAATRLDEVRELALGRDVPAAGATAAADADWDRVRETLADMDDETRKGSTLLEQAWADERDADALERLSTFVAEQAAELQALLPVMAPEARSDAEASLDLVSQMAATTSELRGLAPCTEACSSSGSAGSGDADCDCGSTPTSSPRPSATPSASPTPTTSSAPSGSAPPSGSTAPEPDGSSPPPPSPAPTAPGPLPTLPSLPPSSPLPTQLPTDLSTDLSTVAPSTPLSPLPLPVPSLDSLPDDLVPG